MSTDPQYTDNSTTTSDLDWLAFCYVADELDSAQRAAFEQRLEHDQLAREAVGLAVSHAMTLDAAIAADVLAKTSNRPLPQAVDKRSSKESAAWRLPLALAAAAAALMLILFSQSWTGNGSDSTSAEDLAEVWVNTLVSLNQEELEEFVAEDMGGFDLNDDDSWLFAALDDAENEGELTGDPMEFPEDGDLQ